MATSRIIFFRIIKKIKVYLKNIFFKNFFKLSHRNGSICLSDIIIGIGIFFCTGKKGKKIKNVEKKVEEVEEEMIEEEDDLEDWIEKELSKATEREWRVYIEQESEKQWKKYIEENIGKKVLSDEDEEALRKEEEAYLKEEERQQREDEERLQKEREKWQKKKLQIEEEERLQREEEDKLRREREERREARLQKELEEKLQKKKLQKEKRLQKEKLQKENEEKLQKDKEAEKLRKKELQKSEKKVAKKKLQKKVSDRNKMIYLPTIFSTSSFNEKEFFFDMEKPFNEFLDFFVSLGAEFYMFFFIVLLFLVYICNLKDPIIKITGCDYIYINFFLVVIGTFYIIYFMPSFTGFSYGLFFFYSQSLKYIKMFFLFFVLLFWYIIKKRYKYEYVNIDYFFILMFSIFAGIIVFSINDFLLLYLDLELFAFCLYLLATFNVESVYSTEAGLKYFIFGSIASAFFLFGISLLYFLSGSFNFSSLLILFFLLKGNSFLFFQMKFLFPIILIFLSFVYKIGLAPFHLWLIDVYTGVEYCTLFFFTIFPKYIYFFLIFKLVILFERFYYNVDFIFFFCGLLSIVIATFSLYAVFNLRKILAYSSIINSGFVLICLSVNKFVGIVLASFYLIVYLFLMFSFFLFIFSFVSLKNVVYFESLSDLAKLFFAEKNNLKYFLLYFFSFIFFSLAGIPPFLGFFSKFFVLYNLMLSKMHIMYLIVFFLLMINLVSVYVYLRCIVYIFFENDKYGYIYKGNYFDYLLYFIFFLINVFAAYLFEYLLYYCYMIVFF